MTQPMIESEDRPNKDAASIVRDCITEYGAYSLQTKFPHLVDGLKPVHRRAIEALVGATTYRKFVAASAPVILRHPHGDSSINDAIVRLGQPWNHTLPLVDIRGSVGSYSDPSPSAVRYLEIRSSEFASDVYYNGVGRAALVMMPDLVGGTEPQYLIPKIPMALLTGQFGIGIGYSTAIPPLHFVSLCKLTKIFIKHRKTIKGATTLAPNLEDWLHSKKLCQSTAELLVPSFTSPGIIANYNELLEAYRKGDWNVPIKVDGMFTITPTSISVNAIPPNNPFFNRCNAVATEILNKNSWAGKVFREAHPRSNDRKHTQDGVEFNMVSADFIFNLKRGVDPYQVLDEMKRLLQFRDTWNPVIVGLNLDNKPQSCTPLELIEIWYIARHRSILAELRHVEQQLVLQISKLKAQLIIKDHTDQVIQLIRTSTSRDQRIALLCKQFNLTPTQAQYVITLRLEYLAATDQQELVDALEQAKNKLEGLRAQFGDVDGRMINDIDALLKKYEPQIIEATKIPNYCGAIYTGTGITQFWNEQEMCHLLSIWEKQPPQIVWYNNDDIQLVIKDKTILDSTNDMLPKDMATEFFTTIPKKARYTVVLRDKKIFKVEGVVPVEDLATTQVAYVEDCCVAVTKRNEIEIVTVSGKDSPIPVRKTTTAQGIISDYQFIGSMLSEDMVIVHGNSSDSNVLRFERITPGHRLKKIPIGKLKVVALNRLTDKICFMVPRELQGRSSVGYLMIDNVARLLPNVGDRAILNLKNKKFDNGMHLKKRSGCGLYTLD